MRLVNVKFRRSGKRFLFNAGELELQPNLLVVVQLEKGLALGAVVGEPWEGEPPEESGAIQPVLRKANEEDLERAAQLRNKAREAFDFCMERIKARQLPMKLVEVEFLLDESRATFFFTAEGRVDFRELVRDLAHQFRTRIEMLQIGVRDESKILGGFGICGRELCCSSWLVKFNPVSIRMAKDQSLSLNPSKVSGVCGRLMCCLAYEHEQYLDMVSNLPRPGKRYVCSRGPCRISRIDVLNQRIFAILDDGTEIDVSTESLDPYTAARKEQPKPSGPPPAEPQRRQPNEGPREPRGRPRQAADNKPKQAESDSGKAADKPAAQSDGTKKSRRRRRRRQKKS